MSDTTTTKSKVLHFYSSKLTAFFLFLISSVFVFFGFVFYESIFNFESKPSRSTFLLLALLLFLSGIIISIKLLFRKKPLLTISTNELVIYTIFRKPIFLRFHEIKSFYLVTSHHKGIPTNRKIFIELKEPSQRFKNSVYYRITRIFSLRLANSQYGIQADLIKINHNELLEILNDRLQK